MAKPPKDNVPAQKFSQKLSHHTCNLPKIINSLSYNVRETKLLTNNYAKTEQSPHVTLSELTFLSKQLCCISVLLSVVMYSNKMTGL